MSYDLPDLNESQKQLVAETLKYWASVHPEPDKVLGYDAHIEGGRVVEDIITPHKMAEAAAQPESNLGFKHIFRSFAIATKSYDDDIQPPSSLNQVMANYRKEADEWAAQKLSAPAPRRSRGPGF